MLSGGYSRAVPTSVGRTLIDGKRFSHSKCGTYMYIATVINVVELTLFMLNNYCNLHV